MNIEESKCILWTKALDSSQFLLHSCDTPACVNPLHLRIGTQAENIQEMYAKGRGNPPSKTSHYACKLTEKQVEEIRSSTEKNVLLAQKYSISASSISYIKRGKRWKT